MAKLQIHSKQLSMVIDAESVRGLTTVKVSDGYTLREYHPGDEDTWIPLVNMGQFSSVWDVAKFEKCTRAVAPSMVKRGYGKIILFTDDWRLPAIGLYLSMGFEPQMSGEDMPERWDAIHRSLHARP